MTLEQFVIDYGYAALFVGTFLEGDTTLVIGGFLANRGYLELAWVISVAFLGTFIGDQMFFYLGRSRVAGFLEARPGWRAKSDKVFLLLHKHQIPLVLGFRYLYGLRSVTAFVFGASRLSPSRFFILNCIGALLWAVTIGCLGYLFGTALELTFSEIKKYEIWLVALMILAGMLFWIGYLLRQRMQKNGQVDS